MISRRQVVLGLGAVALAKPLSPFAQQSTKVWRIGVLSGVRPTLSSSNIYVDAFTQGMRELGYIEGKNLIIERRYYEGKYERAPDLAAELLQRKVDVFVMSSTPVAQAVQRATRTTPIVFVNVADPVGSGLAASLARPGGSATGLSLAIIDVSPKHIELLRIIVPRLSRVALLVNAGNPTNLLILHKLQAVAQTVGMQVLTVDARTPEDIERGFTTMKRERAEAVIVVSDSWYQVQRKQISDLALRNRLPSMFSAREYVEVGGLIGYGSDYRDAWRHAATHVDKILKGAKPGDLPIEQPTLFKFQINRKTAKALGLTIPQELLLRADEVID